MESISGEWSDAAKNNNTYQLIDESSPYQLEITLDMPADGICSFNLENEQGESFKLTVNNRDGKLITDRTVSGQTDFSPDFGCVVESPLNASGSLKISVYVDYMSIETLVNDGISQQTNLVFPQTIYNRLVVNADSPVQPSAVKVRKIQPVW